MPYQRRAFAKGIAWVILAIIGGGIAFLLLQFCNYVDLTYRLGVNGNASYVFFCWFLATWSIFSGLLIGNKRSIYVTLHVSTWFFWLGVGNIFAVFHDNDFSFLYIPLCGSLLLVLFFPLIIRLISNLLQRRTPLKFTDPPLADRTEQPYEQGYQTISTEGRQLYPGVNEDEVPTYISHQRMEDEVPTYISHQRMEEQ